MSDVPHATTMNRVVCLLVTVAMLGGCGRTRAHGIPAQAYVDWKDRFAVATGLAGRVLPFPCEYEDEGDYQEPMPLDQCVKVTEQRRWQGYWRNDFEGSRFCPGTPTACDHESRPKIWFGYYDAKLTPFGGLYEVEFIGRQTLYPGGYGHMGMSDHEMMVDRLISIKQIEAPPPEPTKAQIVANMKACEAKRTCIPNWEEINKMEE